MRARRVESKKALREEFLRRRGTRNVNVFINDFFIGGIVDRADNVVILYRGNLERMAVPLSWFVREEKAEQPDFGDFEVTDLGQTVRFGRVEASADAILYAFDADYRKEARWEAGGNWHILGRRTVGRGHIGHRAWGQTSADHRYRRGEVPDREVAGA